jgi:HK97 gp10 family phage protein
VPSGGKRAKVTITVEGMDRLRSRLEKLPDQMRAGAEKAVRDETEEVEQDMRDSVPVDTGALRDGMQAEVDGLSGKATSTAPHSWAVEGGTSRMPARPFAQPAAERSRVRFPDRVNAAVREELPK